MFSRSSCVCQEFDLSSDVCSCVFFFNDTATTEIYTLSLHDALPIFSTAEGLNGTTAGTKVGELSTKLGGAVTWIGILILVVFASAVLVYFYNK